MSLVNLIFHSRMSEGQSISNPEITRILEFIGHPLLVDHHTVMSEGQLTISYFGGLLIGMYGLVCLVYVGAMAITGLLSTMYQDNKQQLHALQLLVEKQEKKLEALEQELETQKQNTQTMYNALGHDSGERELKMRVQGQQLTDHSNNFLSATAAINANAATTVNHSEVLKKILHHMHEQNTAIYMTHLEVEKHTRQLDQMKTVVEELTEQVGNYTGYIDAVDDSVTELEMRLSGDHDKLVMKLEDAIDHFNRSKDALEDKVDEQTNVLESVEEQMYFRFDVLNTRIMLQTVQDLSSAKQDRKEHISMEN